TLVKCFVFTEDGIGVRDVTGVQTCALAISGMFVEFPEELERNNFRESISRIYQIQFEDLRKMVNHMALAPQKSSDTVRREGPRKIGRASCRERVYTGKCED